MFVCLATVSTAFGAISLTWGTPASGTSFAVGTTISCSGSVTSVTPQCSAVYLALTYWDGEDEDTEVVTDTTQASVNQLDGAPFPWTGSLVATQYNSQTASYYIAAVPLNHGVPYNVGGVA